ncbi:MAG: DUF3990 domain-containing protein [Bacteroidales bacterium]|nr:DUF3990 domain-containing protein [Bacteroidales bacterium]
MQVYHGGYTEIFDIDLSKCQPNKDFGKGFYITKFRKHAETWAINMAGRYNKEPFVTEFTFYERAFEEDRYKTLRFEDYCDEWLDFVVLNRDPAFTANRHDYDIVEGPIADDKVQNRINEYLDGIITKQDFLKELKYHEKTHQICFCTVNSLQLLKKTDTKYSSYVVRISESIIEHLMIDLSIDEKQATDIFYTSKTFADLSDKSTGLYEKSWREIYELLKNELK